MYYCEDCGAVFEDYSEPPRGQRSGNDPDFPDFEIFCHECDSTNTVETDKKCALCGEYINPEDSICGECFDENKTAVKALEFGIENRTEIEVNGLLAHIYGDRINDILMEMYAAAPKELNNAEADAFIADCKYDFIDFLIKEKGGRKEK